MSDAVCTRKAVRAVEAPVEKPTRRGADAGTASRPPPLLSKLQDERGVLIGPFVPRVPLRTCPSQGVKEDREAVSWPPADKRRNVSGGHLVGLDDSAVDRLVGGTEGGDCVRRGRKCKRRGGGDDHGCVDSPNHRPPGSSFPSVQRLTRSRSYPKRNVQKMSKRLSFEDSALRSTSRAESPQSLYP